MTSITLPNSINEEENDDTSTINNCPNDNYKYLYRWSTPDQITKTNRALSCNEESIQSSTPNNRFRHLCTRVKRRFTITKDFHTRNEDIGSSIAAHFSKNKPFSKSIDNKINPFDWPDFEKVYDTIPPCLAKVLPGLDDICVTDDDDDDDNDDHRTINRTSFSIDEHNEQEQLFEQCRRGKNFRRNAICRKIDKNEYHGQLDTFIQQLMIEKLIRTWT